MKKVIIVLLLFVILCFMLSRGDKEHFKTNKNFQLPSLVFNMDKIYAKLYDITFNEKYIFDFDVSKIKPTLSKF